MLRKCVDVRERDQLIGTISFILLIQQLKLDNMAFFRVKHQRTEINRSATWGQ
jgi:hypothetical protein